IILCLLCSVFLFAQQIDLNASWQFLLSEAKTPEQLKSDDWYTINLPHTWNDVDAHDEKRGYFMGAGWYKKTIFIPKTNNNKLFLKFEGANQHTAVFVNGKKAGEHKGGYTAFVIDISSLVQLDKKNEIAIRVDNAFNRNIPPLGADFTFYGGIYRDLWLIRKADTHFDITDGSTKGIYFSTKVTEQEATFTVKAKVLHIGNETKKTLSFVLYDREMKKLAEANMNRGMSKGLSELEANITLNNPHLWSPDDPYLYTVEIKLKDDASGIVEDTYIDRVGFRWFDMAEDRSFLLNGKPLKLIGVNRHQDFKGLGNALPDPIHRNDMKLLKEMGANFIRIAHYPQDPAILEACDELGILVWEETPLVNHITLAQEFTDNSVNMVREMIRQHYNHTSVIMWGFMNEILLRPNNAYKANPGLVKTDYYKAINKLTNTLNDVCKEEDPSRLTTIAHHGDYNVYEESGLNDITDVVGWNIYYGWYGNDFNRLGAFLDKFHKEHPDKGIIVAEYGAGADARLHSGAPKRFDFTIEWQTAYHASYFQQMMDRPHVTGAAIWNFVDFGSEGRKDAIPRINSKGLVNNDRSLKDGYLFYQAALLKEPYSKIGSLGWRIRTGLSDNVTLKHPVFIFSNEKKVELVLNGKSLGSMTVDNYHVKAGIPFVKGENVLEIKGDQSEDRAEFQIQVFPSKLNELSTQEIDLCMNVGSNVDFYDPIRKQYWMPERAYEEGGIGYIGGTRMLSSGWKVGTGTEINGSDLEPVYQTHRDTIDGFRADLPDGWYEVTLHFAEIYSKVAREKLAYNLGADEEGTEVDVNRVFSVAINEETPLLISNLTDFHATPMKTRVLVLDGKGLDIQFKAQNGSSILCGIEIKGL
ncbi:MAG: glycoside hydrolase family 2 TIM barrel-domain containing protein, partial [Bacteroidota bacterium]